MQLTLMKSKIHRVRVTSADLNYEGSISIDPVLLRAADIRIFEKVQVVNINNGARLETYVIEGQEGTGEVQLNGPAARLAQVDDLIIIISYASMSEEEASSFEPKVIMVDSDNRPL